MRQERLLEKAFDFQANALAQVADLEMALHQMNLLKGLGSETDKTCVKEPISHLKIMNKS